MSSTRKSEKKYQRWDPEGSDAIVAYKELLKNDKLQFKDFLRAHKDWTDRYRKRNLSINFKVCRDRLKDFQSGEYYFKNERFAEKIGLKIPATNKEQTFGNRDIAGSDYSSESDEDLLIDDAAEEVGDEESTLSSKVSRNKSESDDSFGFFDLSLEDGSMPTVDFDELRNIHHADSGVTYDVLAGCIKLDGGTDINTLSLNYSSIEKKFTLSWIENDSVMETPNYLKHIISGDDPFSQSYAAVFQNRLDKKYKDVEARNRSFTFKLPRSVKMVEPNFIDPHTFTRVIDPFQFTTHNHIYDSKIPAHFAFFFMIIHQGESKTPMRFNRLVRTFNGKVSSVSGKNKRGKNDDDSHVSNLDDTLMGD